CVVGCALAGTAEVHLPGARPRDRVALAFCVGNLRVVEGCQDVDHTGGDILAALGAANLNVAQVCLEKICSGRLFLLFRGGFFLLALRLGLGVAFGLVSLIGLGLGLGSFWSRLAIGL